MAQSNEQGSDELQSIHMLDVKGLDCPACGHPCLMFIDGYITCTLAECPNPDFSDAIEAYRKQHELEAKIEMISWCYGKDGESIKRRWGELEKELEAL